MARPQSIDEGQLTARLADVFHAVGYEGASLAMLSKAAGLQKASLYHRFPGGKKQMADHVLDAALGWFGKNVIAPLERPGDPHERLAEVVAGLDDFYCGGERACLLNMLASPRPDDGPFTPRIKAALRSLIGAFGKLSIDAGLPRRVALRRAERAVALIQGGLVLSRGLGSREPFQNMLATLPRELLMPEAGEP